MDKLQKLEEQQAELKRKMSNFTVGDLLSKYDSICTDTVTIYVDGKCVAGYIKDGGKLAMYSDDGVVDSETRNRLLAENVYSWCYDGCAISIFT